MTAFYSHYEKLDEMYAQLAEVSLKEGNRDLIYGLVDCKDSPSVCEDNLVARNVELKVIALRSKVETVINFLTTLIDDVLNEDAIIDRWEEPGKCFVLFKVVSCKYCKIALKNWNEVKKHFSDRNSEICLGMVDCNRHRDLCHRYEIRRYPRFYWFDNNANGHFVSNFTGDREASQLIEFAEEKLKDSS